ncbi:siroheme synthase CysG [Temperatibacter marinus]|uniref:Siroheme synthase CysG n=1 Tax=Temperatibacter marinus TaxID=1456591 RepID=A0AA52ED69_9PROT|nr:siroheme synthase CysG [Temperatibacter marinus]WND01528.1 siroheme synthase CysG [Temperatibacter marinus]
MNSIPLFLRSDKQHVLIAGATSAAVSKASILLERGVKVCMVGEGMIDVVAESGLQDLFGDQLNLLSRAFKTDDLLGKTLVYIAENDPLEEERILTWTNLRKLPVNVVDKPADSDFTTPAAVKRGEVSIAIASGGAAPVFIRRIRAVLERSLPSSLSTLSSVAGSIRGKLKTIFNTVEERRKFWDEVYDKADEFSGLKNDEVHRKLLTLANEKAETSSRTGLVQLVGAGPGDPELLTLKAHRAVQQADIIYYDRLVSQDVLSLARRDAEIIFVGKREGDHGVGQDKINQLLVEQALLGKTVVRLKGGDPLTFARAGEELAELRAHSIPVQIIPGITALSGIASKTQIPLTDRNHSASVSLITGTLKDGSTQDWKSLAGEGKTLAVYMGLKKASEISSGLIEGGVSSSTPVAIIENGTRANERQFYTTLSELPTMVEREDVKSPALLIIGDVVSEAAALQNIHTEINQARVATA